MTTPASGRAAVPTYGWMIGMSAWLLLPLIGPGVGWLGFLGVGILGRRRVTIVIGAILGVVAVTLGIELWGGFADLINAIAHLGGIVAALAVNPGWLRTMWQRRGSGTAALRFALGPAAEAGAGPGSGTGSASSRGSGRGGRAGRSGSRRGRSGSGPGSAAERRPASTGRAGAGSSGRGSSDADRLAAHLGAGSGDLLASADVAEPIDVQTATADELRELPGMNGRRARRAVKARTERNGFVSVEDFGESAGLQPHEIVRLRSVATCSPRPRGARGFGRRVDL